MKNNKNTSCWKYFVFLKKLKFISRKYRFLFNSDQEIKF